MSSASSARAGSSGTRGTGCPTGDGPYGAADELGWREAADERLCLLTPDMQNRRIVDGAFAAAGARPRPVVETKSRSTLYARVRAGGVAVAHAWLHPITTVRDVDLVAVLDRSAASGR